MVSKLEVTAFGTDFRSNQQVGAVFSAEVCSSLIAGHNRHVLMEHRERALAHVFVQERFKRLHHLNRFANQEHLVVSMFLQESLEPHVAFVERPGVGIARAKQAVFLNVGGHVQIIFGSHVHHVAVILVRFQRNFIEHAFRESAHALTGIAEYHRTCTYSIHNAADPFVGRHALCAFLFKPRADNRLLRHAFVQVVPAHGLARVRRQLRKFIHQLTVSVLILDKAVVVRKAHGVEHLEAVELRFRMELQRRTRQKEHALRALNHGVSEQVLVARESVFANQVVRFVDNHHVPSRLEQVFDQSGLLDQEVDGANNIVCNRERIRAVIVVVHEQALDVAFVHQREQVVKATLHFHKPLVLQRFGHNNQSTGQAAAGLECMPNHAGFNRLTEAHFVREHQARERRTVAGAAAQVILVRNHRGTRANHATHRRRNPLARKFHGRFSATELHTVRHAIFHEGLEQVRRTRNRNLAAQFRFLHLSAGAARINQQAVHLFHRFHGKRHSLFALGGITHRKFKAVHRGTHGTVATDITYSGERNLNNTVLHLGDYTKPESRFRLTYIALANLEIHHTSKM